MVFTSIIPAIQEASPGKKVVRSCLKTKYKQKDQGCDSSEEHLPSMREVLGSLPSMVKKKKPTKKIGK
jgi:hypothetical protein